jgi:hypothetical protein
LAKTAASPMGSHCKCLENIDTGQRIEGAAIAGRAARDRAVRRVIVV